MNKNSDLNDLTERLVKFSMLKGASQAEIFAVNEKKLLVKHKGESLDINSNINAGFGIRVAFGKKWSFTSSSSLDEKSAKIEIEEAIKIAKARDEDPDFFGFPASQKAPMIKNLASKELKYLQIDEIMNSLNDARDKALSLDKNLANVQGSFQRIISNRAIANSLGLQFSYDKTSYSASFSAVGSHGSQRFSENSFTGGTKLQLDLDELALDAARRTIDMFGAKSHLDGGYMSLIMEPTAAAIFFIAITRLIFKGNLALSNRSIFQMKDLNTEVASPLFTFIDDGTMEGGIKSAPIDDEGSPSKRTTLIESGILKNFLFDYSQAKKGNVEPTGNAIRGIGHSTRSYTALPNIGSRDRIVQPGTKNQDELIRDIDKGVLIGYPAGIFLSNPMTTDFTIFPTRVLEIKNGEITRPILGASMSGNGIQWLKQIEAVGNDANLMESVISPSVVFSNVNITSSGSKMQNMQKIRHQ
ncbi:MAG: TldD/PmbA family protein [Candidatus Hodarchaeota archaeon]